MKRIYKREAYLRQLRPFYDSDLIKVITGIRRCGKSCLLRTVMDELRERGIPDKDILYLNLDERGLLAIKNPQQLAEAIDARITDQAFKYLLIDEIQNVANFEPLINAYRETGNCSIFITGSNSYLLSGELVTKLTGRFVEIPMFTLSFSEYLDMRHFLQLPLESPTEEFSRYIREGGFPQTLEFADPQAKSLYLRNLMDQILRKDVTPHTKIRNRLAFDRARHFIINNFGATTNLSAIANYLTQAGQATIRPQTLKRYADILANAKIIFPCRRFDLKSRKSLQNEGKFYLCDTGIYFANNPDGRINYGPILENVLFTHLISRGYTVSVGRIGKLECDFIASKNGAYAFIQVAMTIAASQDTEDREYRALEAIRDNSPKYLFTLDTLLQRRNGIRHLNLIDFISSHQEL